MRSYSPPQPPRNDPSNTAPGTPSDSVLRAIRGPVGVSRCVGLIGKPKVKIVFVYPEYLIVQVLISRKLFMLTKTFPDIKSPPPSPHMSRVHNNSGHTYVLHRDVVRSIHQAKRIIPTAHLPKYSNCTPSTRQQGLSGVTRKPIPANTAW